MLRLEAGGAESLWDELLPEEVRVLPADLAALDELLCDRGLLAPIVARWEQEAREMARSSVNHGRPTMPMDTFVRLMVLKHRYGWGYRTLMAEVSDSLHLRRFARIGIAERVPDESTVRKLTRRLGPEVVNDVSRSLIAKATREKRFRARAVRIDSTVIEADIKYPTDAGLASHGVRALAREGRKLAGRVGAKRTAVRDRSRSMGRRLRAISRTIRRRTGQAKQEVLDLTAQTGQLLGRSVKEARRLVKAARASARGRGAKAKLRAAAKLEELAGRCERVVEQIKRRVKGERITDRLVSLADPDARPIRKGKLGKPNEFGYVAQLAEVTPNTKRGARGFILPPATAPGNPGENTLLPQTVAELMRLALRPREFALDGGFQHAPTDTALESLAPNRVFIAGRHQPGSKRTQRRMRRYRTGAEGRISHLKRGYGLRRSRLKGDQGQRIWTGWGTLAYNLDTYTRLN
jgi:IS5 family transposase